MWLRRLLIGVGTALLLVGLVAGVANRQLLDTSRFASHADAVRRDPAVARQLAIHISDRMVAAEPDLVAVRPLVEGALQQLITSAAFRGIFRTAVEPLHQAWTGSAPSTVVLQVADLGAVTIAVVRAALPQASERIPAGIEVRLARFGSGSFGRSTLGMVRAVRVLSWLCPVLMLMCFAAAVALARGRRQAAIGAIGLAVLASGLGLAVAAVVVSFVLSHLAPDTLGGALVAASWDQLAAPMRNTALLAAGVGYLVVIGTRPTSEIEQGTLRERIAALRWRSIATQAPIGTAVALVLIGVLLVIEPTAMVALAAIALGIGLVLHGSVTLLAILVRHAVARRHRARDDEQTTSRPLLAPLAVAAAVLLLTGVVVWDSMGGTAPLRAAAAQEAASCNGSSLLCTRRYDEVSFPATHNSMSAADQPGWFLAEQPDGVIEQLDHGIRAFLIDTWYAQATQRNGVVANVESSHATALAQARKELGADVVESALRLRDTAGLTPRGPVAPYLCHALCELGATRWEPLMERVRTWLDQHPREVVTFILQDEVSPATTAQVLDQAGLMPDLYTPSPSGTWPTLEQMIDSGHRVVVMAENEGGGTRYPWLQSAFHVSQDTPYDARRVPDFTCRLNRGPADADLFLVNHWLNQPLRRVRASRLANSDAVLGPRLTTCERERGRIPNFVAVDYYDQGDLFGWVDTLNGLQTSADSG